MKKLNYNYVKNYIENMILLDSTPTESTTVPVSTEEVALSRNSPYFYNSNSKQFGILNTATNTYKYYPDLFAVHNNGIKPTIYKATILSISFLLSNSFTNGAIFIASGLVPKILITLIFFIFISPI